MWGVFNGMCACVPHLIQLTHVYTKENRVIYQEIGIIQEGDVFTNFVIGPIF